MITTTTSSCGPIGVTYLEESTSSNQELTFSDGFVVRCDAYWIADQIEDGAFLLVSLVDRDEVERRLG